MARIAPSDRHLTHVIRQLAEQYLGEEERVVFLGPGGEVKDEMKFDHSNVAEILSRRSDMLARGELKVVLHLNVMWSAGLKLSVSVAEIVDGAPESRVFALLTWLPKQQWLRVPADAMDRWITVWDPS